MKDIFSKMILIFAFSIFIFNFAYAMPLPRGVDGLIFYNDNTTEMPVGTNFTVCNLITNSCINGSTGYYAHSGRYSVALSGDDGTEISIKAWSQNISANRTVILNGSMHGVNLFLNIIPPNQLLGTPGNSSNSAEPPTPNHSTENCIASNSTNCTTNNSSNCNSTQNCTENNVTNNINNSINCTINNSTDCIANNSSNCITNNNSNCNNSTNYTTNNTQDNTSNQSHHRHHSDSSNQETLNNTINAYSNLRFKNRLQSYSINPLPDPDKKYIDVYGSLFDNEGRQLRKGTIIIVKNLRTGEQIKSVTGVISNNSFYVPIKGEPGDTIKLIVNHNEFNLTSNSSEYKFNVKTTAKPIILLVIILAILVFSSIFFISLNKSH